jgi:hypothetical protein
MICKFGLIPLLKQQSYLGSSVGHVFLNVVYKSAYVLGWSWRITLLFLQTPTLRGRIVEAGSLTVMMHLSAIIENMIY